MRYGAKILFDEVSTAFTPGKRYGLTGPNGAGKSTFMKLLTGELEPQKGTVVRPAEARRSEPGPVRLRRLSRDRYRHHGQQAPVGGDGRARRIYEKHELTDEDGMRLGELEGIVGEEDGYSAETDAAICCKDWTSRTNSTSAR
jgi:ATPase subunit of ABC transporter with duplicated ATPase domains